MGAADVLRKEVALPFTKKEFIDKVCENVRNNGYYAFFHGRVTSLWSNEFDNISCPIVLNWAKEEGFKVEREYNVYGVPNYYVTL